MKYNRQNRTENPLEVGGGGGDEAAWGELGGGGGGFFIKRKADRRTGRKTEQTDRQTDILVCLSVRQLHRGLRVEQGGRGVAAAMRMVAPGSRVGARTSESDRAWQGLRHRAAQRFSLITPGARGARRQVEFARVFVVALS